MLQQGKKLPVKSLNASGVFLFSVAWKIWLLLAKYVPGSTTIGW
jgi:hypothetical protein